MLLKKQGSTVDPFEVLPSTAAMLKQDKSLQVELAPLTSTGSQKSIFGILNRSVQNSLLLGNLSLKQLCSSLETWLDNTQQSSCSVALRLNCRIFERPAEKDTVASN